jgi:hypothetical protein
MNKYELCHEVSFSNDKSTQLINVAIKKKKALIVLVNDTELESERPDYKFVIVLRNNCTFTCYIKDYVTEVMHEFNGVPASDKVAFTNKKQLKELASDEAEYIKNLFTRLQNERLNNKAVCGAIKAVECGNRAEAEIS